MTGTIHAPNDVIANRYTIIEFLDEGGMQEVYVAEDDRFGRRVALKVPKSASAEKRFDRTARLSARVVHPNVAATLDYVEDNGRSYLIEQFVRGSDLRARFDADFYYLDPYLAAHVFGLMVRGVAAAHHAKICHRDLKPSNVIVSLDPGLSTVKITDFGIAKMAQAEMAEGVENWEKDESSITGSKTLLGAIPYMAPEQFTDTKNALLASDIWALGSMLCQLVGGDPPFGRGAAAIAKILNPKEEPSRPALFGKRPSFKALEDGLWEIVTNCLQRKPAERPTADELVNKCSVLCYATTPRETGVIEKYGAGSGDWGFIRTSTGGNVFLPRESFYGATPKVGMKVNFAPHPGRPNPRAAPCIPLRD